MQTKPDRPIQSDAKRRPDSLDHFDRATHPSFPSRPASARFPRMAQVPNYLKHQTFELNSVLQNANYRCLPFCVEIPVRNPTHQTLRAGLAKAKQP